MKEMENSTSNEASTDKVPIRPSDSWKSPPSVSDLRRDYIAALPAHQAHVAEVEDWIAARNITGKHKQPKRTERSSVTPKLIRKSNEWRYATLSGPFTSTEDVFNVQPVGANDVKAARQNALILNNQFNTKFNKIRLFDDISHALVEEGTAVIRCSWVFEEKQVEVEVPVIKTVPMTDPNKIAISVSQGLPLFEPKIVGTRTELQNKIVKNHAYAEVCHYKNIIFDPTNLGDPDKSNFYIYQFETSIADLTKDNRYFNLDKIELSSNNENAIELPDETNDYLNDQLFVDDARKKLVAIEHWVFWDINGDNTLVPIVATYIGHTMIRLEENPYPDKKHPFTVIQYMFKKNSITGEPDAALIMDNQAIKGAAIRGAIDIMGRSANSQIGTAADSLTTPNLKKFRSGKDYEFNPNIDPSKAFYMHKFPELPRSVFELVNMQDNEAESVTGITAFNTGISGNALGDSVGGIKSATSAAARRELAILNRLVQGIIEVGRKFIAMNGQFLSDTEVIRITEDDHIEINRVDLAGDFDLKLSVSTPEADDAKAQELAFMQQTANEQDPEEDRMVRAEIARLRNMPALAKRIEEFQPQPDPVQQRLGELEVALKEAEVAKVQAEVAEKQASALYAQERAVTEKSKQSKLQSETDNADLNFIEQQEGVSQARDLQKLEAAKKFKNDENKS